MELETVGRVLVTGANGNLGRRLLARLARAGAVLRAVVRSERAAERVRGLGLSPPPELVVLDYADADAMARAVQGCSAVVHLVGILKESSRSRYADAHEGSCGVLADVAKAANVERIVYLSVLGADPDSPNACLASKGRAERILLEGGVPTTVLRVPMVLGGDDPATLALRARTRARIVPLVRGGASLEQPIDPDDVIAAVLAALERPEAADRVLELAGPESLPHRELLRRAATHLGRRPLVLPVPLAVARAFAALAERRPDPPLTRAMLEVLEHDDRIDPAPACEVLGIRLTALDETLRRCLAENGSTR